MNKTLYTIDRKNLQTLNQYQIHIMNRLINFSSTFLPSFSSSTTTQKQLFGSNDYYFSTLGPHENKIVVDILIDVFLEANPMILGYLKKFPQRKEEVKNSFQIFFQYDVPRLTSHGMSIAIHNQHSKELVGVITVKDAYYKNLSQEYGHQLYSAAQIVLYNDLYRQLSPQTLQLFEKKGQVFQFYAGASKKQILGKKFSGITVPALLLMAKSKGFKHAVSFVINTKSGRYLEKSGFKTVATVDCYSFEFQGIKPFELIGEEDRYIKLMMMEIK